MISRLGKSKLGKRSRIGVMVTFIGLSVFCAACGTEEPLTDDVSSMEQPISEEQEEKGAEQTGQAEAEQTQEGTLQELEEIGQEEVAQEQESVSVEKFSFADVAEWEFYFSSGAGGWSTVLYIHEDGTFDGLFRDSDMGVADPDEYPNGTISYSEFFGMFTEPEKVDDTTYVFQIESIEYPMGMGEEIKDGYYYDYGTAYGLDGAVDLYLYLPGAKLADLPEAYRSWVGYYDLESVQETELPFYGLYNVNEENGFSSYVVVSVADQIKEKITEVEMQAAKLEEKLQNAQTQADLNVTAGEIYMVWDDTLNIIWGILKENLDKESMEKLLEEQRSWIVEKEAAMQEAGEEVEGGSLYSLTVNMKAAELTQERVYELVEYLQ